MAWTEFANPRQRCDDCGAHVDSRVYKLPGEGSAVADLAIIGEGPGEEEERLTRNFVGRAGDMLDSCLREVGIPRASVWIENSVKCRCLKLVDDQRRNRKPSIDEIDACRGFLVDSLQRIQPKVILSLGDVAMTALVGKQLGGVTSRRGRVQWSDEFNAWIVFSFHPAYALRFPAQRQFIIEDMRRAQRIIETGAPESPTLTEVSVISTLEEARSARDAILASPFFTYDWETYGTGESNGLHLRHARGFCLSVSIREGHAYVFPRYLAGLDPAWSRSELPAFDQILREILTGDVDKGGFNVCAFDNPITASTLGVWPTRVTWDGAIAYHLLYAHLGERANALKVIAASRTDMGRYDDALDQWLIDNGHTVNGKPDKSHLHHVPDAILHQYSGMDADAALRIRPGLIDEMRDMQVLDVFNGREDSRMEIAREHGAIDRIGVRIDREHLEAISADLSDALLHIESSIEDVAGRAINPGSPKQLAKFLFQDLGLPVLGRTPEGEPSTAEEYLDQMRDMHDVIPLVLKHREFAKIKGTYVDGTKTPQGEKRALRAALDDDGYARMNTRVAGPETMRFATRAPFAIHTFPKNTPRLPSVRALVIPDDGYRICARDWSQQEWAIATILAGQDDMTEAILDRGEDVHELVTRQLGGISKDDYLDPESGVLVAADDAGLRWKSEDHFKLYKKERSKWKSVNFQILFRGGAKKLARVALGCRHPENTCGCEGLAANFISLYYERYDKIRWWQYRTVQDVRRDGYVRNPFGTFRRLPGIHDSFKWTQFEAERMACNAPIQMSGAHMMIRALLKINKLFTGRLPLRAPFPGSVIRRMSTAVTTPDGTTGNRVIVSVHDEILTQVRADLVEDGSAIMKAVMEEPVPELGGRSFRTGGAVTDRWGG